MTELSAAPEKGAEDASRRSARLVDALELVKLTLVEPDPAAVRTLVNLHVFRVMLLQVAPATRAFVEVGLAFRILALGVQLHAHFMNLLEVLFREILVLIPTRLFIHRHCGSGLG
ncbi:MAG TPA: hypothetical protein VK571_11355 [Gemmatimonadaceae bacterium]|nr:hypothetical protein [Gemmatimonadaceae bacterium]